MHERDFYKQLAARQNSLRECEALTYFGAIYSIIFVVCLITNVFTLKRLYSNKNVAKPISYLFYYLYALNLFGGTFELPVVIVNSFSCR